MPIHIMPHTHILPNSMCKEDADERLKWKLLHREYTLQWWWWGLNNKVYIFTFKEKSEDKNAFLAFLFECDILQKL